MKMPSELFKPGSVGDALANDLAGLFARTGGWDFPDGHKFRIGNLQEGRFRANAETAITWMLQPDVREKLGGMK